MKNILQITKLVYENIYSLFFVFLLL